MVHKTKNLPFICSRFTWKRYSLTPSYSYSQEEWFKDARNTLDKYQKELLQREQETWEEDRSKYLDELTGILGFYKLFIMSVGPCQESVPICGFCLAWGQERTLKLRLNRKRLQHYFYIL